MDLTLFNNQQNRQGNTSLAISKRGAENALQLIKQRESALINEQVRSKLTVSEFSIAIAGTKTPLCLLPEHEVNALVMESVIFICRDVGIKTWNDEEVMAYDTIRFLKIITSHYNDFSFEEIKGAFELAAIGALNEYLPKDKNGAPDKNHYQSFSMEYYTKILNAYRSKRSHVWGKVRNALPAPEFVISQEEREANKRAFHADIYDAYINYQKGVSPSFPISAYIRELQALGHIKELPTPGKRDIDKAYNNMILTGGLAREEKKRIIEDYDKGIVPSSVKTEAELRVYNQAIAGIFDDWIKKGFDLIETEKPKKRKSK